ncbi:MAG: hypothetical protein JWM59_5131 [Verrucomicrobiales bacterium]|nr:hypothetical protein [Verrucomicrobiales bacterium]
MMRLRHKLLIQAFRLSDQVSLWVALFVSVALFGGRRGQAFLRDFATDYHPMTDFIGVGLVALIWWVIFALIIQYDANRFTSFGTAVADALRATTLCSFQVLMFAEVFDVNMITGRVVAGHWLLASALIILCRGVLRLLLTLLRKSGYNRRNVVFVGANPRSFKLAASIEVKLELGYHIQGFVLTEREKASEEVTDPRWPVVCGLADFRLYLETGVVDEVMVCLPVEEYIREIFQIFGLCRDQGLVVRVVPDLADLRVLERAEVEEFDGEQLVTFFRENLLGQLLAKRILDVSVSGVLLILLSPLLLAVALGVKLTSPGPVLFSQERVGMNKRKFQLFKFRSMVVNAEELKASLASKNEMSGPAFKIKNDPRVTKVGRILRKTSIDELPQLWNVLKGEMSLVGPRPPLPKEVEKYEWLDRRRLSIKPGITCLWQVGGRSNLSFKEWMELDKAYCDHWSFWLDLKILLKTIPVVLLGKGAS